MDSCGGGVAGVSTWSQIVEKKFRRSRLGRCRALHRKRPRVRLHPYRTPAQEGNLEFCTLRTDRSLTRWTCPARNRAEFNFLTSTTPADASKRSEEHTSELQSHSFISYAVFCL